MSGQLTALELLTEITVALRRLPGMRDVDIQDEHTITARYDDTTMMVDTRRIHDAFSRMNADDRREAISAHLRRLIESRTAWDDAGREQLVVVPRPAQYTAKDVSFERDLADGVTGMLAMDSENLVMYVHAGQLADLGLSEDDAFERALYNLGEQVQTFAAGHGARRTVGFVTGDSNDAARGLFLPDLVKRLCEQERLPRPWMLCVPARDIAILASYADLNHALRVLENTHVDYTNAEHELFPRPFGVDEHGRVTELLDPQEIADAAVAAVTDAQDR